MGLGATRSHDSCPGAVLLLPGAVRPLLGIFGGIGSCGTFSPIVHTIPLFVKFVKALLRIAQHFPGHNQGAARVDYGRGLTPGEL